MRRSVLLLAAAVVALLGSAVPAQASSRAATPSDFSTAGGFHAVDLTRVLDTRNGTGGVRTLAAGASVTFAAAGVAGIPLDGVAAVAVNVTVLTPARSGSVSLWPGGTGWDGSGTISFSAGPTAQHMLIANVGKGGQLSVRNNLPVAVNIVADVTGYFESGRAQVGGYQTAARTRVLDTRRTGALAAKQTTTVQVSGVGGLPVAAGSAVLSVTVLTPGAAGSISVYDGAKGWNGSATISFAKGATEQDVLLRSLSADGSLDFRNNLSVPVTIIVDVTGTVAGRGAAQGLFCPITDDRVYDTRNVATGPVPATTARTVTVGGDPLPSSAISAVVVNVTVLNPTQSGSVTIYPGSSSWPGASTITFVRGQTVQRTLIQPLDAANGWQVRNNTAAPVNVIGDVVGYLLGAPAVAG